MAVGFKPFSTIRLFSLIGLRINPKIKFVKNCVISDTAAVYFTPYYGFQLIYFV